MPDSIRDGKGSGVLAGVNAEHYLLTTAVSVSKEHHTNFTHQDAYNMLFDVTPTGAGDVFLYVKNTGDEPIVCEGFNVHCASDEELSIYLGAIGTPAGGSDVVPANLTAGSAVKARGTFQTGADITGLSNGVKVADYGIEGSVESKFRNFDADIVIPQNQTMYMAATNGAIQCHGFLVMWHDHSEV